MYMHRVYDCCVVFVCPIFSCTLSSVHLFSVIFGHGTAIHTSLTFWRMFILTISTTHTESMPKIKLTYLYWTFTLSNYSQRSAWRHGIILTIMVFKSTPQLTSRIMACSIIHKNHKVVVADIITSKKTAKWAALYTATS